MVVKETMDMSDEDRAIEAAFQEVFALAAGEHREGGRRWTMCIPVQPTDSDEVICKGLHVGQNALQRLSTAQAALAASEARAAAAEREVGWLRRHIAFLREFAEPPYAGDELEIIHDHAARILRGQDVIAELEWDAAHYDALAGALTTSASGDGEAGGGAE